MMISDAWCPAMIVVVVGWPDEGSCCLDGSALAAQGVQQHGLQHELQHRLHSWCIEAIVACRCVQDVGMLLWVACTHWCKQQVCCRALVSLQHSKVWPLACSSVWLAARL